ncbi:MAG: NUDIX domain-containing protein [Pseudonocardiaceae bacterium]
MRKVEIKAVRTLFDDYFRIDEAELRYELPGGRMSDPSRRLSFERGDSTAAVVVNESSAIVLLTRQFRFPTFAKGPGWMLELVAGTVEVDESPEQCIRREIVEELGYETLTLRRLCTFYTSPGGSSERIHLFQAVISAATRIGSGGGNSAEQEDIELVEIPLNEVPALLASGDVVDAKTIIGLSRLVQEYGKAEGRLRG